jgi:hypothetical protein
VITRDVGDRAQIRYAAYSADGVLTDTTAIVTVTDPSGGTSTPSVTHTSTGIYDAYFDVSAIGTWKWEWVASGTIVDVAYGQLDALNPAPPMYASLDELKSMLRITNVSTDDLDMTSKLVSAQGQIEDDCGRRFYRDSVASSRIYMPTHPNLLEVDDIATATGLIVEIGTINNNAFSTLASTAFDYLPDNCLAKGRPIEYLRRTWGAWATSFNTGIPYTTGLNARVRVTAVWGWPSIPEEIKNATLLKAARLFRRKDSPEGIRGFSDMGVVRVTRYDPDYDNLIGRYVRVET